MATASAQCSLGQWPTEVTSFVGRRSELSQVRRALAAFRLVSLTGVGGVGKTRLASRAAWNMRRTFPDGVWLVELAGLEDEGLVAQAIVSVLGISDQSTRWTAETVAERIADQKLLLLLDNCEHILHTCALTVATLLERCPHAQILATSRQPLGIIGECLLPVSALEYPQTETAVRPSTLAGYEAIALFADRAKAVVPDFVLDERNGPVISGICRHLDGIPLAIELAAVSLRVLSPEQVLRRLDDRFSLLTAGKRVALPRHQTLRALIEWSYDLCSSDEKTLWARASVFAEGFDLEGAEAVCADEDLAEDRVLDAVAGLVDKSILIREDRHGQARYRLLETIRQYGRQMLIRSGQESRFRRRHRDWWLYRAEQMRRHWFGPHQPSLFARLRTEHANIRTALEFCLSEADDIAAGTRIADALRDYWRVSGLISEGRRWCDRILRHSSHCGASRLRLLISAGYLAVLQNDLVAASALLGEARKPGGDTHIAALLRVPEGLAATQCGDFPRAIELCEEAVPELRDSGDLPWFSTALVVLGMGASLQGDSNRATAAFEELLALSLEHDEKWRRPYALWGLGVEAWRQGRPRRAATLTRESLGRLQQDFDDLHAAGMCTETLAWVAASEGRHDESARLLGAAETIRGEAGGPLLASFRDYHEHCEQRVRNALGGGRYRHAFAQGADMNLDHAVAYALGRSSPHPKHIPQDEPGTLLSRRERDIAELVRQGMTNKQIAGTLVISQRTAETHVEHILVKLGFTSRSQIAAWAADHQNTPSTTET